MNGALDGHGRAWCLGHDAAEAVFVGELLAQRLHHAWLFTGPPGIGKATLAFRLAQKLLDPDRTADHEVEDDAVMRRIAANTHADLQVVGRSYDQKRGRVRDEIVVDDVRRISDFLHHTSAEGGWRVVILDDADCLNRPAANALLKVLEEPPPRTVLMLICSIPGRLPSTIRSRCRTLRLRPLSNEHTAAIVRRLKPDIDPGAVPALVESAGGSPGRVIALARADHAALSTLAGTLIEVDGPQVDPYPLADTILHHQDGLAAFLATTCDLIAARMRQNARSGGIGRSDDRDLAGLWQELRRVQMDTERFNLDKRQALLSSLDLLSRR